MRTVWFRSSFAAASTAAVLACGGSPTAASTALSLGRDDVIFLTLSEEPAAHMDALFRGTIAPDDAGCLRAAGAEHATVIWRKGFSLRADGGTLSVVDTRGRTIGRVGGDFLLGGGYVASLHDGIPMTASDRQAASAACPGPYWIVGEVPGS